MRGVITRVGAWCVLFSIFGACFLLAVVGAAWLAQDPNMMSTPGYRYFPWSLFYLVLGSIAFGVIWGGAIELWQVTLAGPYERLFGRSRVVLLLGSIIAGASAAWGAMLAFAYFFLSINPILVRYGFASLDRPENTRYIWPVGLTIGFLIAVFVARNGLRELRGAGAAASNGGEATAQEDPEGRKIRALDLDVETSRSGVDDHGFPFFVWRESADNRLGFSRPRYCRAVEGDDDLLFQFFDPSQNVRSTGSNMVTLVAGGGIFVWAFGSALVGPVGDSFATVVAGLLFAGMAALALGGAWYAAVTMGRWAKDRFEGDGRLYVVPWRDLVGFQVVSADATGADRTNRTAPGGEGLFADFGGRVPSLPLTANFWNHESIAEKHRLLTAAFVDGRGALLGAWHEQRKRRERQQADAGASSPAARNQEVPAKL